MVTVTGVIRSFVWFGETTFKFGPTFILVIAAPDAVVPTDIHHTQSDCVAVCNSKLIWPEQPIQKGFGFGAALEITNAAHPVHGSTFFVFTLTADSTIAWNPYDFVLAVGRLNQVC
jgi:hypothetical protein